jgi:endonuclease-3
VLDEYEGDAANIWTSNPPAGDLARRFRQFYGLGQKTAAVGVANIAWRIGSPTKDMEEADIAYDVHVRRVFLRTRLATRDDQAHMIATARELNPAYPGALDYGAWLIGRDYCRPHAPRCAGCPLTDPCPKDLAQATHVRGA